MTDDQLLAQLRHDLDDFVGEPGPAPAIDAATVTTRRARPAWLPIAAAAATIAVVVAGLVAINGRDEPDAGEVPPPADGTMPVPPTPDGWTVVEWGDLRMSVPPEMDPFTEPSPCATEQLRLDCSVLGFSIQFDVDPGSISTEFDIDVNGVGQHRNNGGCGNCDVTQSVLVRPLRLDVLFHDLGDEQAWAIADTIGVSSRWRAANEPAPDVPADWDTFTYDAVRLRVPAGWTSTPEADGFCLAPEGAKCNVTRPLAQPRDFVHVGRADQPDVAMLPIAEQNMVGSDGAPISVHVGLGVDGTIGRTIFGSVTSANPQPTTVGTTAPPAVAPAGLPVPPTPNGWVVLEWGDVRLSLPPDLSPYDTDCAAQDVQGILDLTCGDRKVTVIPNVGASDPDPPGTIDLNGVAALRTEIQCPGSCSPDFRESTEFLLVDLGTLVRFTGFDADTVEQLAATIGVSSQWRVDGEPAPAAPADWATYEGDWFTFRYPAEWEDVVLGPPDRDPDFCRIAPTVTEAVTLGRGDVGGAADCDLTLAPPTDGVRVFQRDDAELAADDGPTHTVVVTGAGGDEWVVRVGFGVDGTTGRAIVGSIRGVDVPAATTVGSTAPPTPTGPLYGAIATVVQAPDGPPQLCREVLPGNPPITCNIGVSLTDWSWDMVDDETERVDGVLRADDVYVVGSYPSAVDTLTVTLARSATAADFDRMASSSGVPVVDQSLPCDPPAGGWDAIESSDPATFPVDVVVALDGYAGHWLDPTGRVWVVKVAGDTAAAAEALREGYQGPTCVVRAERSLADLSAIEIELRSMSSVRFGITQRLVDVNDEYVLALSLTPQPQLQASLDDRYGVGTVVLTSLLQPAD